MTDAQTKAIVVGGGVIGAACAHYLLDAGFQVTLVDAAEFGKGCSHANCGLLTPSHALPLCVPGAIGKTMSALLDDDAPFSIKPRFSPTLWGWLFKFASRCKEDLAISAGHARLGLLNSSMALYRDLFANAGFDCEFESRGVLCVYQTREAWEGYGKTNELLSREFGLGATPYEAEAAVALEPALRSSVAGAWHFEMDAHLRPDKLMAAWRDSLVGRGMQLCENTPVTGIRRVGKRAQSVEIQTGSLQADLVVVATGAWTPKLQEMLGCKIPIQPGKGYSITMPRPAICPSIPLLFPEHKVGATPMQSGYRLGSTMEFAGYDSSIDPRRIEILRRGARPYLQEPYCEPVTETWFGWRPMTYDGVPIIDRTPAMENVYIAAGHNMLGLSMAPATGKLLAEIVTGGPTHLDPAPYRVSRFQT